MENKNILIGVTGGIAAYKTCELVRLFVKDGYSVKTIMTDNAAKLVSPIVFRSLGRSAVYTDTFGTANEAAAEHIDLAKWTGAFVIAPATANTIGKIVHGIADNLLTTTAMAIPESTPLFLAPAMNMNMWDSIFVRENMKRISGRKNCIIIGPETGMLADGTAGAGRMSEPAAIFDAVKKAISR
jgi:phosphopantothenoylcysteine decarboxylase / phosphopantothenate---cysteine ligase